MNTPRCLTKRSQCVLTIAILIVALGAANAVAAINRAGVSCVPGAEQPLFAQQGLASWYSPRAIGRRTASGESTASHALTAAHRTLPFGSVVRVTNLQNCRAIKVTINDRGPSRRRHHGRILDLSKPAAVALGMTKGGVVTIKLEEFQSDQPPG